MRTLLSWIGNTDLRASRGQIAGEGPIAQAVATRSFEQVFLLSNYAKAEGDAYTRWLAEKTGVEAHTRFRPLSSPTNFGEVYEAAVALLEEATTRFGPTELTIHLSPGTPAMAAVWVILGKTRFPAELIQSSIERGVETASVPFDISADFIPDLLRGPDAKLNELAKSKPAEVVQFGDILCKSSTMLTLVTRARRVAPRNVPVLIEGESGTGKELLARAIHAASPRKNKPFVAVNCGAIPRELIESQLFGHEKGAFTGADSLHRGFFEQADGGTIFLDEIGELPMDAQVKLLRVLQEREVTRLRATKPQAVDIRVLAATNRELVAEVAAGRFRSDLFYRLAVAVLKMPPLRERRGDVGVLVDHMWKGLLDENRNQPGFVAKHLSAGARNVLLNHAWPGNVRELMNTLQRIVVWCDSSDVTADDAREAIISVPRAQPGGLLDQEIGEGFDIQSVLDVVAKHYLEQAMALAKGNKTKAAQLLGLGSYQTLTNWLRKYGSVPGHA